jgi:CrcB protein
MEPMILVAIGGAAGSLGRYWAGLAIARLLGESFPWGTLVINLVGSFVIGAAAALTASGGRYAGDSTLRLLVMTGLCGGFTTFSSFSLQTMALLRAGDMMAAGLNIMGSVGLCLLATAAGLALFTRG